MTNTNDKSSDHHYLLAVGGILAAVALIALVVINPEITGMAVEQGVDVGRSQSGASGIEEVGSSDTSEIDVGRVQRGGSGFEEEYTPGASVEKKEPQQPQKPVFTPGPGEAVRRPMEPEDEGAVVSNPLGVPLGDSGLGNAGIVIGPVQFKLTGTDSTTNIPSVQLYAVYEPSELYAATTYNPAGAGIVTTQMTQEQLQQFLNLQLLRFDTQMEIKRCITTDECAVPFQENAYGRTYEEEGIVVFIPHVYFTGAP